MGILLLSFYDVVVVNHRVAFEIEFISELVAYLIPQIIFILNIYYCVPFLQLCSHLVFLNNIILISYASSPVLIYSDSCILNVELLFLNIVCYNNLVISFYLILLWTSYQKRTFSLLWKIQLWGKSAGVWFLKRNMCFLFFYWCLAIYLILLGIHTAERKFFKSVNISSHNWFVRRNVSYLSFVKLILILFLS